MTLPPQDNLPVLGVDAEELDEKHYRRLNIGEPIHTGDQFYRLMPPPGWYIGSFFTADGQKVTGRTAYRRANSLRAWLVVAPQIARKWWARFTQKTPSL